MLVKLYDLFLGIKKSKNQLISLDMIDYIIANTLKLLVVTITGTDEENKNKLIELFLMVM